MKPLLIHIVAFLILVLTGSVSGQDVGGTIYGESVLGVTFIYFDGPLGPATPVVVTLTGVYLLEVDSTQFPQYFVHLYPLFNVKAACESTSTFFSPSQAQCTLPVNIARANSDMPRGSQMFLSTYEGRYFRMRHDVELDKYELLELGH